MKRIIYSVVVIATVSAILLGVIHMWQWGPSGEAAFQVSERVTDRSPAEPDSDIRLRNESAPPPPESREEAIAPAVDSGLTQRRVEIWPYDPERMEELIRAEVLSGYFGSIVLDDVVCITTTCEIFVTKSESQGIHSAFIRFATFMRNPPFNACGTGIGGTEKPDGLFQERYEISTCREPPPEQYRGGIALTADELRDFGSDYLSPEDFDAEPVVVHERDGHRLVVENICSTDCPLDLQQVIHWESAEGLTCQELKVGVATSFLVRDSSGAMEVRTLCVVLPYE